MQMLRTPLTVRRMMVLVALMATSLAVGLFLSRRRDRLLEISLEHVGPAAVDGGTIVFFEDGPGYVGMRTEKGRWHEALRRRYDYYGRRPWLPMPPDPPEPE